MTYDDLVANLLVAGVTKSATSSLYWYLSQHPEVCPPAGPKEIDFFTPMRWGDPPLGSASDYGRHFRTCDGQRYRLDASPQYFDGGAALTRTVRSYSPDARVIIVLRDPVRRVWSNYRTLRETDKLADDLSFREFFERGMEVHARGRQHYATATNYRAASLGRYVEFLSDWHGVFGDKVLVLFFEHLMADPHAVVARVCNWLDIDPASASEIDVTPRNRTIDPRSLRLSKIAYTVNRRIGPTLHRIPVLKDALRRTYFAVNRSKDGLELSADDRALAERFYAAANEALARELLRRGYTDLPDWVSPVDAPT